MKKLFILFFSAILVYFVYRAAESSSSELWSIGGFVAMFLVTIILYYILSFIVDTIISFRKDPLTIITKALPKDAAIKKNGNIVSAHWIRLKHGGYEVTNCVFDLKTEKAIHCQAFTVPDTFTGTISEVLERIQTK